MRVAVAGASAVVGRCALPSLVAAGHEVVAVDRGGVRSLLDVDAMAQAMRGCDAVVNLAAQIPVGLSARFPRAWRTHDLLRSEGATRLVEAARQAGVRRVVHQGVSLVYADQGEQWIDESAPLCVTGATEPVSVGEARVQDFASVCRTGVVLRMGLVLGDSAMTRWMLRATANGRPVGIGARDGYMHVIHSDDVGPAVLAALDAPSGTFNVGAEPVLRQDLVDGYAQAVGRERGEFLGPVLSRLTGLRLEPLSRSLRVSSERFGHTTGWAPRRERFDVDWLEAAGAARMALR